MSGLSTPRGLTFGPNGGLYVAEAVIGGGDPSIVGGDGSTVSYGLSGGISRLLRGTQIRVVVGLPFLAPVGGGSETGLHDLVFDRFGALYGIMSFGADPALRGTLINSGASGGAFSQLVKFDLANGSRQNIADVAALENTNPNGTDVNSNSYSLTIGAGRTIIIADAGANDLLQANPTNGNISVLTVFPT